jgi:hypothetical protein
MVCNMNFLSREHNEALKSGLEQLTGNDVISVTIIRNVGGGRQEITLDTASPDFRLNLAAMRRFEVEQVDVERIIFNFTGATSMLIHNEERISEGIQEWLQLVQDVGGDDPDEADKKYIVATLFETIINQKGNPAPSLIETIEDFAVAQGLILANTANQPWLITAGLSLYLGIPHEDAEHLTNYWVPRLNPVYLDQLFRPSAETRDFNQFHRDIVTNMLNFIDDPESVKKGWENVDSSTFLLFTSMAAVGFMRKYPSLNVEATKLAQTLDETFKDPKMREQLSEAFDVFTKEVSMFQSVFEVIKEELGEKGDGEIAETTSNLNEALKNVNEADKEIVNEIAQDLLPLVTSENARKVENVINTLEECARRLPLTDVEFYLSSEAGYTDTDTDTMPRSPQGEIESEAKSEGKSTKVWLSEKAKEFTEDPKNVKKAAKVYRRTKESVKAFPSSAEKAIESGRNLNPNETQLALADQDGSAVTSFIVDSEDKKQEKEEQQKDKSIEDSSSTKSKKSNSSVFKRRNRKMATRNRVVIQKKAPIPVESSEKVNESQAATVSESNLSEQGQGIFASFWSGLGRTFSPNSSESNRSYSPIRDDDSGYSESSSSDEKSSVSESSSSDEKSSVSESSSSDEKSSVSESSSSDEKPPVSESSSSDEKPPVSESSSSDEKPPVSESSSSDEKPSVSEEFSSSEGVSPNHSGDDDWPNPLASFRW